MLRVAGMMQGAALRRMLRSSALGVAHPCGTPRCPAGPRVEPRVSTRPSDPPQGWRLAGRTGFPKQLKPCGRRCRLRGSDGQASCRSPHLWGRCPAGQRGCHTAQRRRRRKAPAGTSKDETGVPAVDECQERRCKPTPPRAAPSSRRRSPCPLPEPRRGSGRSRQNPGADRTGSPPHFPR
ncbi:hypothetical protein ACVITL_002591 [Rhizobium pisi]